MIVYILKIIFQIQYEYVKSLMHILWSLPISLFNGASWYKLVCVPGLGHIYKSKSINIMVLKSRSKQILMQGNKSVGSNISDWRNQR